MSKKTKVNKVREMRPEYKTHRVMEYPVIIHHSKYGYDVECSVLPGCCSQGDTFDEAIENIKDAIKTYLDTVEELSKRKLGKNKKLIFVEVEV